MPARGTWKQKMIMWKNLYRDKNLLVLIEANGNTRAICNGITDSQIQKYRYLAPYCPEQIETGTEGKQLFAGFKSFRSPSDSD